MSYRLYRSLFSFLPKLMLTSLGRTVGLAESHDGMMQGALCLTFPFLFRICDGVQFGAGIRFL